MARFYDELIASIAEERRKLIEQGISDIGICSVCMGVFPENEVEQHQDKCFESLIRPSEPLGGNTQPKPRNKKTEHKPLGIALTD